MKKLTVTEWPAHSPDLNPIEQFWEVLDCRIRTITSIVSTSS